MLRFRFPARLLALLIALTLLTTSALAQEESRQGRRQAQRQNQDDDKLTLEKAFPDRSPFGPTASSTTFSKDGRFAAFLYRPYDERRHGSDLYIYDTQTGEARRVTSASRMAEYQASARRVVEDREKKAKEARHPKVAEIEARNKPKKEEDAREQGEKTEEAPPTTQPAEPPVADRAPELIGLFGAQIAESSDASKIEPGASARLVIRRDGDVVSGVLHAGLIRLPLRAFKLEGDVATAQVGDGEDGLDGILEATWSSTGDAATLSGTVTLVDPELNFSFEARRDTKVVAEANTSDEAEAAAAEEKPEAPTAPEKRSYATGIRNATGEQLELGDLVTRRDHEDSRAPRYGGVQSIEWSPRTNEMLVLSEGDIYLLKLDPAKWEEKDEHDRPYMGEMQRLTRTRERESSVAFLPDGSGYTYLRDGALLRVSFGDHSITQLDPPLEDGERMVGYRISPDGKRLVFLASRRDGERSTDTQRRDDGQRRRDDDQQQQEQERERDGDGEGETRSTGRQVTLISYRSRFATARQVPRTVADDEHPAGQASIYLYDLEGHEIEKGKLKRVFTRRTTGPRDVMAVPEWSPDSKKVAFSAFQQETGQVMIVEADLEDDGAEEKAQTPAETPQPRRGEREERQERQDDGEQEAFFDEEAFYDDFDAIDEDDWHDFHAQERRFRGGDEAPQAPATQPAAERPAFSVEGARIVYRFFHNGGPNTPRMIIPQYLADSRHLVFVTELSGFRHLHVLDPTYEKLEQITSGLREIYPFQISEDHKRLFVTATVENDPAQEWVYQIDLESREMKRLCNGEGVISRPAVSDDGRSMLAMKVDFGAPAELVAFDCSGDESEELVLSDFHPEDAHKLTGPKPEYFSFQNRHGHTIHGHMFKPKDWKPEDKRPLLIYVYGGPLGQRNQISRGSYASTSYYFARYMTENHGWVTATVDPRGASGLGAVFEKANFEQVGKPQTEDLVDAANWLSENAGVDPKRRALHGWSFGGFQTQMTMYTDPEAFAAGIAGAGPTEWQNYNSWYTTGTVAARDAFKKDLDQFSLLPLAKNLKGRLLLVHGVEDSNVLYQDTIRVYRELLRAGKEPLVDLFIDPTGGHGLGGDVKTIGRYRKYEDFLLTHVGKYEPPGQQKQDSLDTDKPTVAEAQTAASTPPPEEQEE